MARIRLRREVAASAHQVVVSAHRLAGARSLGGADAGTDDVSPPGRCRRDFVGRTGMGPVGFHDPMTVTGWKPPTASDPGRCTVRKTGRVVLG